MRCNIHLGGQGAVAYKKMLKLEGPHYMEELEKDKNKVIQAYPHYVNLLAEYKELLEKEGLSTPGDN